MSRIGKLPVAIPEGVNVEINVLNLKITGPKGELNLEVSPRLEITKEENAIIVTRKHDDKTSRALHGLWRVLISNAVTGVSQGNEKKLDFKGVGYKAEVQGDKLVMSLGFSHPVEVVAPEGISFNVTKNVITVSGIDKQLVGQIAANIRKIRPVEPYKGKGLKYIDEVVRRKLGKAAKAAS